MGRGVIGQNRPAVLLIDLDRDAVADPQLSFRDATDVQHIAGAGLGVLDEEPGLGPPCPDRADLAPVAHLAAGFHIVTGHVEDHGDGAADGRAFL